MEEIEYKELKTYYHKGDHFLQSKDLAKYVLGVSNTTISDYVKRGLVGVKIDGERAKFFNVREAREFVALSVDKKHSSTRNKPREVDIGEEKHQIGEPMFEDGTTFADKDINDAQDLEQILLHPLGEQYIDGYRKAEDILAKQHALRVKKGEYILMSELNVALSEMMALVKNSIVSMRDILPISQIDNLIKKKIMKKDDKTKAQKVLAVEVDKSAEYIFKDINDSMLKRLPDNTKRAIKMLENIVKDLKKEV